MFSNKVFIKSIDPSPKETEKRLNNEAIFLNLYTNSDATIFKNEKISGIKRFRYK